MRRWLLSVTVGCVCSAMSAGTLPADMPKTEAGTNTVQATSVPDRETASKVAASFVTGKGWDWGTVMQTKGPFDRVPKEGLPERFWVVTFEKKVPVKVFGGIGDTLVKASVYVGEKTGTVRLPEAN